MRYVLYSPGYGAGWTSWSGDTREQRKFMLEYKPLVEYLLHKEQTEEKHLAKMKELENQFLSDWAVEFPGIEPPFMGGWEQMSVKSLPDGCLVRIDEYDGYESVKHMREDEGWM